MSPMQATADPPAHQSIPGLDFVAIDFETANPQRASVCQIGLVKVTNGIPGKQHCHLVFPPRPYENFHERNIAVHGITRPQVNGAPGWDAFLPRLIDFTAGLPLVGHNVSFEKSVVEKATIAIEQPVPYFQYLCSLKLARKHLPDLPSHRLNELITSLELPSFQHHDAGADAEASALLVLHIAELTGLTSLAALWGATVGASR